MVGWVAAKKACVVSGAASGIGRALCVALAKAGARSVTCLDLDIAGARSTAHSVRVLSPACDVRAVHCDATSSLKLKSTLLAAGEIDLYCANAGIATIGGADAPEEDWQKTWELNVMQIARAADVVVPGMVARGSGALLVTASAAGLLTQLGSAPYTATKHAAVGLAEWLAITHGDDGVVVTCVCPQAVRTPMIAGLLAQASVAGNAAVVDGVLDPSDVADEALRCLAEGQFLCMPGGDKGPNRHVERKAADRERWIGGMRRLQSKMSKL